MYAADLIQEIGAELTSVLTGMGRGKILLEFDDVQYVGSSMLGQLVQLERAVQAAKGQLKICGLGPVLTDTFHIGRFDRIFDIHPDEASALKSFRKG
jgi:anti-anti-sigma factor